MDVAYATGYEPARKSPEHLRQMNDTAATAPRAAVTQRVKEIVAAALHLGDPQSLDAAARLDTLGLDSLNIVDILLGIERTFDVTIDEAEIDFAMLESVDSLVDFVMAQKG